MAAHVSGPGLRLVVDNLGPLAHASVALRPLTVLIGRNNTGKTYLAQALYAVHSAVEGSRMTVSESLTTEERGALEDVLQQHDPEGPDGRRSKSGELSLRVGDLPPSVRAKAARWVGETLSDVGGSLEGRLRASFGVPSTSELSMWDQPDAVSVELHRGRDDKEDSCLLGTNGSSVSDFVLDEGVTLDLSDYGHFDYGLFLNGRRLGHRYGADEDDRLNLESSIMLLSAVWRGYLGSVGLSGVAHYLPAGRSGLLHAWTDVVRLRLELERERFGLPTIPDPALDGVAIDFISALAGLLGPRSRYRRNRQALWFGPDARSFGKRDPDLAGSLSLLRQVMEGDIYSGSGDDMVPMLGYEQKGNRIAVRRASSMVADLAPLAMWIDRIVDAGDLLIIDEPESHLHPEAIRLVARVLVRLVGEGVSVVCATHSSVLLHELSNCLLRGRQPELDARDTESGYDARDQLSLDDIAVHRFHRPDPAGPVIVESVEIEPDWGIPEDEYVDAASKQSDDTARLIDSLT